jgi:hypothetical protein
MRALPLAGRGKPISAILSIETRLDCRSWLDSEPSMLDETVSEEEVMLGKRRWMASRNAPARRLGFRAPLSQLGYSSESTVPFRLIFNQSI